MARRKDTGREVGLDRLEQEQERRYLALYHGDIYAYHHLQETIRRAQRATAPQTKYGAGVPWYRQGGQMALWLRPEELLADPAMAAQWRAQGYTVIHLCPPEGVEIGQIQQLAQVCHEAGLRLCIELDLHTTGADHPWAVAARAGVAEHRHRYFLFDDWTIPNLALAEGGDGCAFHQLPGGVVVMTWGGRERWVLNYQDPVLFNDMAARLLELAGAGADMVCLRGLGQLWTQLDGTGVGGAQNLELLRLLRLSCQQVFPQLALMGDGGAEHFGTTDAPGCHLLLDGGTAAAAWSCLATGDVRLLRRRVDELALAPMSQQYAHFLQQWEGIRWQLDYPWLMEQGYAPQPHRSFLNRWYTGRWEGSPARGELWGDDLDTGAPCGTCASLCGVERGAVEGDADRVALGLRCMEVLHALLFALGGIPYIWQGDGDARLNDYGYHRHPRRYDDPRWIHGGAGETGPWQTQWQTRLKQLCALAEKHPALAPGSALRTLDSGTDQVLALLRRDRSEQMVILLNLAPRPMSAWLTRPGRYLEIETGQPHTGKRVELPGYGVRWLLLEEEGTPAAP